jgi:hypothetical protein
MKTGLLALLSSALSASAGAYDQPEVKFFVELKQGGVITECPVRAGSLGEAITVSLGSGMSVVARSTPLSGSDPTKLTVQIFASPGNLAREFKHSARLSQQKPSFEFTFPGPPPQTKITVLAESAAMLATNRNQPSWQEFDPRVKANHAPERSSLQQACTPLLGAVQTGR